MQYSVTSDVKSATALEDGKNKSLLEGLAPELLREIFAFMPIQDVFVNIVPVCQKFYNVVRHLKVPYKSVTVNCRSPIMLWNLFLNNIVERRRECRHRRADGLH